MVQSGQTFLLIWFVEDANSQSHKWAHCIVYIRYFSIALIFKEINSFNNLVSSITSPHTQPNSALIY